METNLRYLCIKLFSFNVHVQMIQFVNFTWNYSLLKLFVFFLCLQKLPCINYPCNHYVHLLCALPIKVHSTMHCRKEKKCDVWLLELEIYNDRKLFTYVKWSPNVKQFQSSNFSQTINNFLPKQTARRSSAQ